MSEENRNESWGVTSRYGHHDINSELETSYREDLGVQPENGELAEHCGQCPSYTRRQ